MLEPALRIARTAPDLEEGCRVAGRYRLGARIENRHNRRRYEAWDERRDRWVQLIVQASPGAPDARLANEGIAQPAEVGCIGAWYVSVLDPGPGEGVARLIGRLAEAPLDLESLMIIALGVCESLEHTGRWGLHHGSLGTGSLHISPSFDPQILDFPAIPGEPLSKSAVIFGSPERQLGHGGDASSDVYALGALLYTLRTGKPPFGWSNRAAREGHLYGSVPCDSRIPAPLMEVLQNAMEKPPRLRYPDTTSFGIALSEAYEKIAGGYADESIPGLDERTEEVSLEEVTTDVLELELDEQTDATLQLSRDMLEYVPPRPRALAPAALGFALGGPDDFELTGTWESPVQLATPTTIEGEDDFELTGTYLPGALLQAQPYDLPDPTSEIGVEPDADDLELSGTYEQLCPMPLYPADSIPPPSAFRSAHLYDSADEGRWVDPVGLAWPRDRLDDEALPLLVLAATSSLVLGFAGAISVFAVLLAGLAL